MFLEDHGCLRRSADNAANPITKKITSAKEPHMGERTHHHDQLMTLQSLRTINATVRRPMKPTPLDDDEDDLLITKKRARALH